MGVSETRIYIRRTNRSEPHDELIGAIDFEGRIHRLGDGPGYVVGYVDGERRVFRKTQFSDQEVGSYTPDGRVRSHGLYEGGILGWLENDGAVTQGGYVLTEEEVGYVEGANLQAGAAALLLIFLPDDAEAAKREQR